MKKFEDRRKLKHLLYSKPVLVTLLLLVIVLARAVWFSYRGSELARENLDIAASERGEIAARIASLEEDIQKLETVRGKEEAFRSKFGMVKDGEEVIVLVSDEENKEDLIEDSDGFWARFLKVFKRD